MMSAVHVNSIEPFQPRARLLMDCHPSDDGTDDDNLTSSVLSSSPRILSRASFNNAPNNKNGEFWTIREVSSGEEELYVRGKCVYRTRNSLIVKSYNFTERVLQAFWSAFNGKDHVCISLNSGLSIFDDEGQHFQIPLAFACHDMYPSKLGLIIERHCDPLDDSSLPILFSLTHPTKEVSAVIYKPLVGKHTNNIGISYSMPSFLSIVACHDDLPLCLMYNSQECQHSIWRIRLATDDEIQEYKRENEDSTATNHHTTCSFREGGASCSSLNISSRQRTSVIQQSNPSSTTGVNFSPKMDLRSKHSTLGNLAASRLGVGSAVQPASATDGNTTSLKSFSNAQTINLTSTPIGSRIINYLRDNIEEPVLPEITFEQFWCENQSTAAHTTSLKASRLFSTSDLVGNNFFVIVTPAANQIKLIKYESSREPDVLTFGRSHCIIALDALPVNSTKMMLVLDTNRNLSLYTGYERLTSISVSMPNLCSVRSLPASSPANVKHSADISPIHMSSARKRSSVGGDRGSFGSDSSIHQMFQALSPVPHAGRQDSKMMPPLSSLDVKKIEFVVGRIAYILNENNQRARFEVPTICQTSYVRKLLDSIKQLVPRELAISVVTKWYQCRRSSTQADLMPARDEMKLFKNWFLVNIGLTINCFDGDTIDLASFQSPTKKSRRNREIESNPMVANVHSLFYAMHLVFEDLLLKRVNYEIASDLVELLIVVACILKLPSYQEYYWLKFPHLNEKFGPMKQQLENSFSRTEVLYKPPYFQIKPPSIMQHLSRIIFASKPENTSCLDINPFHYIPTVTEDIYLVLSIFCEMFNIDRTQIILPISSRTTYSPVDNVKTQKPYRSKQADERVVTTLVGAGKGQNYLAYLPEGINSYIWDAILNCRENPPIVWTKPCFALIGRLDLVNLVEAPSANRSPENSAYGEDKVLKLIFPDDIRFSEASRMLASDVVVEFNVVQRQGATEDESREETHKHLYLLNVRTMAMPIGRGAIGLRTYSPVIGESLEVPKLELGGRSLSEDRPIEYTHDISVYPWPFFHNGVAAGLTICASSANNTIDSTWINYNRPKSNITGSDMRDRDLAAANINNEHAGFLFALGLNGHLEKLSLMALHDYLCQNNDLTKLAVLLGLAAAKRGSRDNNIIKVLSIHVDALLPPNSTELAVPATVHAASILGVGLLYQGSGDSHISKVLLEEIGRLPGSETNSHVDRESFSLSAGLAFGLVNLCKGGSSTISSSDQLRLYMLGGKRKPLTLTQRDRYLKQDCHRGEEEYINTHVTSPGGTLGLGLMYHRSGNQSVANWMRAPDTQTLLEYVRPDFLILRMVCYGLVMWDEIEPTEGWINSHVPQMISANAFQRNASPTIGRLTSPTNDNSNIDHELISQAYCNIVAGCCMAIALKYAGTANQTAYKTIYKHTKMLIALNEKPALTEQAGRPCIEACLNVLVTSLAAVMAGTGDLGVMRVCRYLRSRLAQSCVFYGSYMAVHMALGLLFLGACRYSLSTSPESVGALICALYPIYPNHSSDNRYHLQALRHLYVLAAEPRLLIPRDIRTDRPVYAKIMIKKKDNPDEIEMKAPCLIPELDTIEQVCVADQDYWKVTIKSREMLYRCLTKDLGTLSLKRKSDAASGKAKKSSVNSSSRYESLRWEQLRLACDRESECPDVYEDWLKYLCGETDWTNTDPQVAHYINLYDLKCNNVDDELIESLRELSHI